MVGAFASFTNNSRFRVLTMENHRHDTVVIFAGYPEPMKEYLARVPGRNRAKFLDTFASAKYNKP